MLVNYRPHSMFRSPIWGASDLMLSSRHLNQFVRADRASSLGMSWDVSDEAVTVSAELPGFNADNITIELTEGKRLTLSGSNDNASDESEDVRYLRRERSAQRFKKSLTLPYNVDADAVSADFANGILTVTLPRAEADKPRHITVNAS